MTLITRHMTEMILPRSALVSTLALTLALAPLAGPVLAQVDGTVRPEPRDAAPETVRATVPELFMTTGQRFVAHGSAMQGAQDTLATCLSAAGRTATASAMRQAAGADIVPAGSDQALNQGACALAYYEATIAIAQDVAADGLEAEQAMLDQARDLTASAAQAETERAAAAVREQTAQAQRSAVLVSFRDRAAALEATPREAWSRDQQLEAGEFRRLFDSAALSEAEARREVAAAEQRSIFLARLAHGLERYATGLGELGRDQQLVIQRSRNRIAAIQDGASMLTLQSITLEEATGMAEALTLLMGPISEPDLPVSLDGRPSGEASLPAFPGASGSRSLSQIYAEAGIDLNDTAPAGPEVAQ